MEEEQIRYYKKEMLQLTDQFGFKMAKIISLLIALAFVCGSNAKVGTSIFTEEMSFHCNIRELIVL